MGTNGGPRHPKLSAVPRRGKQAAASVQARQNEATAIRLRRSGAGYTQIAEMLGVSVSTAHSYVSGVLARTAGDAAEDREFLRHQALDRLDAALHGIWERVEAGSLDAINVFLRVEERRSRLLGLDAPSRQENLVTATHPPYEVSLGAREALKAKIEAMVERGAERDTDRP